MNQLRLQMENFTIMNPFINKGQLLTWHTVSGKGGYSIINTRYAPYRSGPFWQVIKNIPS